MHAAPTALTALAAPIIYAACLQYVSAARHHAASTACTTKKPLLAAAALHPPLRADFGVWQWYQQQGCELVRAQAREARTPRHAGATLPPQQHAYQAQVASATKDAPLHSGPRAHWGTGIRSCRGGRGNPPLPWERSCFWPKLSSLLLRAAYYACKHPGKEWDRCPTGTQQPTQSCRSNAESEGRFGQPRLLDQRASCFPC